MSKTVLITGASSGFGKATAELLSKQGFRLILVSRRKEVLDEIAKNLKTDILTHFLDVTKEDEVKRFFENLPSEFSNIDIVINNAGLAAGLDIAPEAKIDDWERMIDTNVKGLLYVTKNALPIMQKRNEGLIINIGSVAATVPYKGGNVYGATKAFVKQFSRNLRTDLFGSKIKVSNIEPGMAETDFSLVRFKGDKEKAENVYKGTHALLAEDIANTILWIINQPERVNIDNIEIMPLDQTFAGMVINRDSN